MKFYFKIAGREHEYVVSDSFVLGRREGSLILDEDNKLSGRHLRFFKKDDCFYVEDLGSSNGTWLNDVPLKKNVSTLLKEGDVVKCGRQTLSLYFEKNISLTFANDDDPDKTKIEIPVLASDMFPEDSSKIETELARSFTKSKTAHNLTATKANFYKTNVRSSTTSRAEIILRMALVGILVLLSVYWAQENSKPQMIKQSAPVLMKAKKVVQPTDAIVTRPLPPKTNKVFVEVKKRLPVKVTKLTKKTKLLKKKPLAKVAVAKSVLRSQTESFRAKYKKAPTLGSRQAIIFQAKEFAENYYAAERRKIVKDFNGMRYPASQFLSKKEETERKLEAMRNREQRFMDMLPAFF